MFQLEMNTNDVFPPKKDKTLQPLEESMNILGHLPPEAEIAWVKAMLRQAQIHVLWLIIWQVFFLFGDKLKDSYAFQSHEH